MGHISSTARVRRFAHTGGTLAFALAALIAATLAMIAAPGAHAGNEKREQQVPDVRKAGKQPAERERARKPAKPKRRANGGKQPAKRREARKPAKPKRRAGERGRRRSRRCRTRSRARRGAARRCRTPRACRTRPRRRSRAGAGRRGRRRRHARSSSLAAARRRRPSTRRRRRAPARRRCRKRRGAGPITRNIGSATERVPRDFFGLHAEQALDWPYGARPEVLDQVAATGVGTMRSIFAWQAFEVAPDTYDFSSHDDLVAQAAAQGMRILPVLFAPPRWRSSRPSRGAVRGTYPPASNAEFAAFAQRLVARYGREGELWSERPDVPYTPITAWQIWNEPNIPVYWPPEPNPDEYTEMLRTVSAAIRDVDAQAKVVTAALPDSRLGIRYDTFLADMYAAGARGSFDLAAINPYSRSAEGAYRILRRAREVIDNHRDDARMWVTEVGWASDGPESRLNVGEAEQAHLIGTVIPTLVQESKALRLNGVIYYTWQDAPVYAGGHDFWGLHTGLLKLDGSAKPAYWRFIRAVEVLTAD